MSNCQCRNIDQANLPPPSGLMPRFGRPWMVKKSVNPLRTVQSSQVSGTMATETIADGPELYVQSSLDSAAVGRPSSTPYALPTQDGLLAQVSVKVNLPQTSPHSLCLSPLHHWDCLYCQEVIGVCYKSSCLPL